MNRRGWMLVAGVLASLLLIACDDSSSDGETAGETEATEDASGTESTAGEDDGSSSEPTDTADDPGPDTDEPEPDAEEPAEDVYDGPVVPPYAWDAQAPWHICTTSFFPEGSTVVTAFDRADQYFGDVNLRDIDAEVDFPEDGSWSAVGAYFNLECPQSGNCDDWDRWGSVQLVINPDAPQEEWEYIELLRHITPYNTGMCQFIDVTPIAPLLRGKQTLRSTIDTWVGPGHPQGDGWRVTVQFVFYPGPDFTPDEIINVWGRRGINIGSLDPEMSVDAQTEPFDFEIPENATRVEAHLTTTGHSFGHHLNCAEFCVMRNELQVNGQVFTIEPWRDDCEFNPVSPQAGTWEFDRNGWCPGAIVKGDRIDITDAVNLGDTNTLDLMMLLANGQEYENVSPGDGGTPFNLTSLKLYVWTE